MIYIVNHKKDLNLDDIPEGYKVMGIGPICDHLDKDNINYLNPYINETTGFYNIWKNCTDEYVGLSHYRRCFIEVDENNIGYLLTFNRAKEILQDHDIICTHYHTLEDFSIINYFRLSMKMNSQSTLDTCNYFYDKLVKIEPSIDEYFSNKTEFIARNMFVCKKEIIDKYCEWLFPIIIPLTEEFVDGYLDKVKGEERMLGHICERLFSYWIDREGLNKYQMHYTTFDL